MSAMTEQERWTHGVGPAPRSYGPKPEVPARLVICQVCGHLLDQGLLKHPDCKPRVVPAADD